MTDKGREVLLQVSDLCAIAKFSQAIDLLKEYERNEGEKYFTEWLALDSCSSDVVKTIVLVARGLCAVESESLPQDRIYVECTGYPLKAGHLYTTIVSRF
jgi:hypothetical protein